jgi:hypothetical protein
MKKSLLAIFLLISLKCFAQPIITFNPTNGATGVSTSNDLTISFSQAIRNIDDSNITNSNVDNLIELRLNNAAGALVPFDATINGGNDVVTVNPSANLLEEQVYYLSIASVENSTNQATPALSSITFTTGDFTIPSTITANLTNNTGASFTFNVTVDDNGTVFYVVTSSATQPSKTQIESGQDHTGAALPSSQTGSLLVTGGVGTNDAVSGLTPGTKYRVHYFTRDNAGNENSVETRNEPQRNSSSTSNVATDGFRLTVQYDMDGNNPGAGVYYVITLNPTPPTPAQILAGQNEGGGSPAASGSLPFATGNNVNEDITGLGDGTLYYAHFLAVNNSGSHSEIHTEDETTLDATPPVVTVLSPVDGFTEVDISTTTFVITFNENVDNINTAASDDTDRIRLFEDGVLVESIDRNDGTVDADGAISADGTSGTATITFVYALQPYKNYHILIGQDVFEDNAGNDFAGFLVNTDWNFTASGITINNAVNNICAGSLQSISDIIITENGVADFNNSGTLEIELVNTSDYIFSTSGVSVSETGSDISSISVTSVTFSKILISYTLTGSSTKDAITISGLKVFATSSAPATIIRRSGGTVDQDGNNGTGGSSLIYASLSVGSSPPATPTLAAAQDLLHCEGEDISTKTLSLTPQGGVTFNWYSDISLSTLEFSTTSTTVNVVTDLGLASPAVTGTYNFYVVAVSGCQSVSSLAVIIQITPRPIADAGNFPTPLCPDISVTIGGSPTLSAPSVPPPPPYIYAWTEPSGFIAGFSSSLPNPTISGTLLTNPGSTNRDYNFLVTITDPLGCQSIPSSTTITVKPVDEEVTITNPTQFNFADNGPPINLTGSPTGGVFTGIGVVAQGDGSYKFDPQLATTTGSPHQITYTTTLANGCPKSISQAFTVSSGSGILLGLSTNLKYCNDESQSGILGLQPFYANILTNANYSVVGYAVTPIGFSTPPDVSLAIQGTPGTVRLITINPFPTPPTLIRNGTLPQQRFNPIAIPPGQYYIYAIIHYDGSPEGVGNFNWVGETVVVNPRPNVSIAGLNAAYCEENNLFNLSGIITGIPGNPIGGVFDISNDGGSNFNLDVDGLINTGAGTATFNPFVALNGSATSRDFFIRYTFSPIGVGSNGLSCSKEIVTPVTVHPLPAVSFTGLPGSNQLCYNAARVNLATNLSGSPSISSIIYSGNGVFNDVDTTGYFIPKEGYDASSGTGVKMVTASATATSTVGCSRTINTIFQVNPPPSASFTFPKSELCYDPLLQGPINLTSQENISSFKITYVGSTPAFAESIPDDNPATPLIISFDPKARFDDAVTNHGLNSLSDIQFLIDYTSEDNLGCQASSQKVFTVSPKINLSIAGVVNGEEYCANEGSRVLVLSPSGGSFSVNNVPQATQPDIGGDRFIFGNPNGGAFTLKYQKISGVANCLNEVIENVTLLPSPQANFSNPSRCVGIPFTLASLNNANAANYRWDMDEGEPPLTTPSVTYTYQSSNQLFASRDYNVELYVESAPSGISNTVCKDSVTKVIRVGNIPKVNFTFSNVCENDITSLNAISDIALQSLRWDFGDGESTAFGNNNTTISETSAPNTNGTYISPNHRFPLANDFNVTVIGRTDLGCCDTLQKEVKLLRKIVAAPLNPYDGMANGQNGFWKTEDVNGNSSWEFATLNGTKISSPNVAWTTSASGPYLPFDDSYMNSPCFDLSGFTRPVISIQYWTDTENSDGATLEYSTNGGASWSLLGGLDTGLKWYNKEVISADPGIKGGIGRGWSTDDQNTFAEGKHTLDVIPSSQRNSVRFRIAFAGFNNATSKDGFAFTNVKIEERNRTLLVENFTNNSSEAMSMAQTGDNNSSFRSFKSFASAEEVVKIQYHNSFLGFDENNGMNPTDNNARTAFYGITQAARGYIDGVSNGRFDSPDNWTNDEFSLRSLVSSPIQLTINSPAIPEDLFNARVTITSNAALPPGQYVVQIAIVEKNANGETFVMRKLLPGASGTPLTVQNPGDVQIVDVSYDLKHVLDKSQLAVIAFVQSIKSDNIGRKNVLQAKLLDTNQLTMPSSVVTGVEQFSKEFAAYPNPADDQLTITLPKPVSSDSEVVMADNLGKITFTSVIKKGERSKVLGTRELAGGIYFVKVNTTYGKLTKKVSIIHQ